MVKAVFLDRDGVINKKRDDYVKNIDEFVLLDDVPKAVKLLKENNFCVIIITNQSAINRGYLSHNGLEEIHNHMKNLLGNTDDLIDAIYYCPHRPDENCKCRKPKPGMLKKAIKDYGIDVSKSWLIGDSDSDIKAANKVKVQPIKIETNSNILEIVKKLS